MACGSEPKPCYVEGKKYAIVILINKLNHVYRETAGDGSSVEFRNMGTWVLLEALRCCDTSSRKTFFLWS